MAPKLIIALDLDNQKQVCALVDKLNPAHCALKVGSELFTALGVDFVKLLLNKQFKIFLDLKFHDIPNTVAHACKVCADLGVWMINVHALGGLKMMQAAQKAIEGYGKDRPLLIGVTVLTSFTKEELASIGIPLAMDEQVGHLACLAKEAGLDGVVSSAHEVKRIKKDCGAGFLAVTPGIRLSHDSKDDQSRVMTPIQAIQAGSDYLVVGRSITQAQDPVAQVSKILAQITG